MIEVSKLTKDYGIIRAVDNISFELRKGDILGFLGPNGAGKSTTMEMITGFLPPTSGTASIGGLNILEKPVEAKNLFGYLPENGPLYPEMTVDEFLLFIADVRKLSKSEKRTAINKAKSICHLSEVENQTVDTLSKGYRQRVGIAQAILHNPQYLLMDEPTSGLDPNQKQEVRKLIANMAENKAIILSTHVLEEVEAMCNRIIIISNGKIIADESPTELIKRHKHFNSVIADIQNITIETLRKHTESIDCINRIETSDKQLIIHGKEREQIKQALWSISVKNDWKVIRIENANTALEDVFAELTLGSKKS